MNKYKVELHLDTELYDYKIKHDDVVIVECDIGSKWEAAIVNQALRQIAEKLEDQLSFISPATGETIEDVVGIHSITLSLTGDSTYKITILDDGKELSFKQLEEIGVGLFGQSWKAQLAELLNVDRRNVTNWQKQGVARWVFDDLAKIIEKRKQELLYAESLYNNLKGEK